MGHLGNKVEVRPWTYAEVISNTSGIDALLDGHSHDSDKVVMENKDGEAVVRRACGTKLGGIGWLRISASDGSVDTGLYTWTNSESAPELLGIENELNVEVEKSVGELNRKLSEVVAYTGSDLVINDPEAVDAGGKPIRIVRRTETNLADLCADAFLDQSGADVAFVNGGGIRVNIGKGEITILENSCSEDEFGWFTGVTGEYRVKNVMVGEEPLDPERTYTLASHNNMLLEHGDGYTMFDGCRVLQDSVKLDNQLLTDYITDTLGVEIGEEYADPYGQGRIVAVTEAPN